MRSSDEWRDRAACLGQPTDLFFGTKHSVPHAKAVCQACPVQVECLTDKLALSPADDGGGVWGGTTENERRYIRYHRHHQQKAS